MQCVSKIKLIKYVCSGTVPGCWVPYLPQGTEATLAEATHFPVGDSVT